jgi:hypothetical protein
MPRAPGAARNRPPLTRFRAAACPARDRDRHKRQQTGRSHAPIDQRASDSHRGRLTLPPEHPRHSAAARTTPRRFSETATRIRRPREIAAHQQARARPSARRASHIATKRRLLPRFRARQPHSAARRSPFCAAQPQQPGTPSRSTAASRPSALTSPEISSQSVVVRRSHDVAADPGDERFSNRTTGVTRSAPVLVPREHEGGLGSWAGRVSQIADSEANRPGPGCSLIVRR